MEHDFRTICDCHCHSEWSFDGCETTDNICQKAIQLGISVIAVTDHCEVDAWKNKNHEEFGDQTKLILESIRHIKDSQQKYSGQIKLLCGLELGQPVHDLVSAQQILTLDKFDFILGSIHNIRNTQDFYWLHYTEEFAEKILYDYFSEVLEVALWNKFDSLAHLTYPLRYICGREKIRVDIRNYFPVIDKIFATLIKNSKALEINTSGLRQEISATMPDEFLLQRYRQMGGELITIGSDAHQCKDIGSGINEGLHILQNLGFDRYYYFEQHQPISVLL